MGRGTREALYDALKKKASENGRKSPEDTLKELLDEFEATGPAPGGNPTGEELQQALESYKPTLTMVCPGYNAPPMDKDTMLKRYEYSKECREVLMTIVKEQVMQSLTFSHTAQRMFGNDFGDKVAEKVKPFRWVDQLIKLSSDTKDIYHNEEVVALAMLATSYKYDNRAGKEAAKDRFYKTRYDHFVKNLKMDENAAKEKAKDELEGAMDRLLNLVIKQMKADIPPMEVADQARDAILTGTADKLPGGLEGAYRKIMNPGAYLAWNIKDITNNFADFGRSIDVRDYNEHFRPYEMNSLTSHDAVVSHVANPFYAILDGVTLANLQVSVLQPKSRKEDAKLSAAVAYGGDISTGFTQTLKDKQAKMLPRFALSSSDDRAVRSQDDDISIYSNRRGRTVIAVANPITIENGLKVSASTDVPGKLINRKFADEMARFRQMSVAHDEFMRSSGKYRSMKRALNALASTRVPDNISKKQARKLEQRVKDLQKATKAYLKRKQDQFRDRGTNEGKDDYEKGRYDFAKQLDSYLDDLLPKAKYIREHAETMEKVINAEQSEAKRMRKAKGRLVLKNPNLTPFQRSVRAEDLKFEEEEKQRRLAEFRKSEEERKAREAQQAEAERKQADAGDALDAELADMEKSIAPDQKKAPMEAPEDMGPALKRATDQADQAYQQALDSGDQQQIKARGEDLLATKAVWEMIKVGYGLDKELGAQMQNIAEGGQLDRMIKGMKNNARFQERLTKTDMSSRDTFNQNSDSSASIAGKYAAKGIQMARQRNAQNNNIINTNSNIINTNSNIINTNSSENRISNASSNSMKSGPRIGG